MYIILTSIHVKQHPRAHQGRLQKLACIIREVSEKPLNYISPIYIKTNSEIAWHEEVFCASRKSFRREFSSVFFYCHHPAIATCPPVPCVPITFVRAGHRVQGGGSMGLPQAGLVSSEHTAQNNKIETGRCSCATWASGEQGHVSLFRKRFLFTHVSQLKVGHI